MTNLQHTRRVADAIATAVADTGTHFVFGHPGGEVVTLIDAFRQAGLRFVLTHHEASAAFAAAGYAELTGRPGVCVATLGPGATNLVTGAASAMLERAAVLAFTGALAEGAVDGTTHQRLALQEVFGGVTKHTEHLIGDDPTAAVLNAIAVACAERPGPVHLSLAADTAAREYRPRPPSRQPADPGSPIPAGPLQAARALIKRSKRPAIIAGLTAARWRVEEQLRQFVQAIGAPTAVTPKAKGLITETDPNFLGVIDMAGDQLIGEFLDDADLIIAIGCDVVELDRRWTWAAPVIHVDVHPNLDGYYAAEVEVVGPIARTLDDLTADVRRGGWPESAAATCRAAVLDHVRAAHDTLQPWHVVESVQRYAAPDTIATCDVGAHKMLVGQLWQTTMPRRFFMANGLSSMGYSIPTALAVSLVNPQRTVIAFVGDGGLSMYLGELETLVRANANVTVIVFADQSLELIRRAEQRRGVTTAGVSFANPDFAALGMAFGIDATEVGTRAELDASLERASTRNGVALIAARIDGADYRL